MTCFRAVRYIVSILVVLSLGLFVAAGVLDYWWVVKAFGMEARKGESYFLLHLDSLNFQEILVQRGYLITGN